MNADPDRRKKLLAVDLMIVAKASLLLGVVVFSLSVFFRNSLLLSISKLFLIVVAPSLAMLSYAIGPTSCDSDGRRPSIVRACVLGVLFPAWLVLVVGSSLRILYTPPALSSKAYSTYRDCVELMSKHDQHKHLLLNRMGDICLENDMLRLRDSSLGDREGIEEYFSIDEIGEMENLCRRLNEAGCAVAARHDDVVLFYSSGRLFLPSPGVLYSFSDANPNRISSLNVSKYGPFVNISGPWYMSRSLRFSIRPNDLRDPGPLPKSLFDRSLETKGIEKNR